MEYNIIRPAKMKIPQIEGSDVQVAMTGALVKTRDSRAACVLMV